MQKGKSLNFTNDNKIVTGSNHDNKKVNQDVKSKFNSGQEKKLHTIPIEEQIDLLAEILIDYLINDVYENERINGISTRSDTTNPV